MPAGTPTQRSNCGSPLPRSEQRRPRTPRNSGSECESDEDEVLKGSSDELLRWADEVLRKAKAPHTRLGPRQGARNTSEAEGAPHPSARPPLSPGAQERRRRAEELRNKIRQLNEESEQDCERLASEEARRRRRFADEEAAWKRRVNSAAEEMRSNFSRWSFEEGAGAGREGAGRGRSVPPPPRAGPLAAAAAAGLGLVNAREAEEAEAAWARLEVLLENGEPIFFESIPWPKGGCGITGVLPGDSRPAAKRKLAGALRRWHPDKWKRILDRVPEAEQARVMERVKSIAQRLLDEKAKLTGPGGVLH